MIKQGQRRRIAELAEVYRERILGSDTLLHRIAKLSHPERRAELAPIIQEFIHREKVPLDHVHEKELLATLLNDMAGYGPLDPLLQDPSITEIMVNGPDEVYIEREGRLVSVPVRFRDDHQLRHIAQTMIAPLGRRLDESNPMVDGRLPDGSRINAVIPPLSLRGTLLSIRRFRSRAWSLTDLEETGALTPTMSALLAACVRGRLNLLITGGASSGKTSLLGALASLIPSGERVVTIEDVAELRLNRPHVIPLETRPANAEGRGEVTIRALIRNALRMRPDRIVIGEVRGTEAIDMLQALNIGHEGSLTTIHANSANDALNRLESLVILSGARLPPRAIRQQMIALFDAIIQTARLQDGSRRLTGIYEVVKTRDLLKPRAIFRWQPNAVSRDGQITGTFDGPLYTPTWGVHEHAATDQWK